MNINEKINELMKECNFVKSPSYEKLVKLKLQINKFYLSNNFTTDELEKRKKYVSKTENEERSISVNILISLLMGIATGAYVNIVNEYKLPINFYFFIFIMILIYVGYKVLKNIPNKYFDEIKEFESDIIDRLLKEKFRSSIKEKISSTEEKNLALKKKRSSIINKCNWCLEKAEEYKDDFDKERIDNLKNWWRNKIKILEEEVKKTRKKVKILEEELKILGEKLKIVEEDIEKL